MKTKQILIGAVMVLCGMAGAAQAYTIDYSFNAGNGSE